jgi:(4-(4-[2-(gamma-L-glutamylamino)ethyl]phenoxymethyl)furan-2-yl)methanamine synthase
MTGVLGWDIGGANVKAAHVSPDGDGRSVRTVSRVFEIWKDKASLPDVLRSVAAELPRAGDVAVTMTAELSDIFRTKREGVEFVLDAVTAVSSVPPSVFTTAGTFVDVATARLRPLEVAASNWMATALLVARRASGSSGQGRGADAILVDVGSTTTDVVPIQAGQVAAHGRTDPERLLAGELVYTGATRTSVAAIVPHVPLWGGSCPVSSELFAISGDVHVLLGSLSPSEYTCPTPDHRPPTPAFASERLARVVCADSEMLALEEIERIAAAIAEAQVRQIAAAIAGVAARFPSAPDVLATGLGSFLARRAAALGGLRSRDLGAVLGVDVGIAAPAVAVACLLTEAAARSG